MAPKSEASNQLLFAAYFYPANKVRKISGKLPPKEGGAFGPVF